jgi:hypothetical protein
MSISKKACFIAGGFYAPCRWFEKVRKEIAFFHDELSNSKWKTSKKNLEILINEKSTLKILPEDMIRNTNNWAAETKSFESSVQFDISEILQMILFQNE